MKNLLCKIGIHDWEILSSLKLGQFEENIKASRLGRIPLIIINDDDKILVKKVCLRCNKFINDFPKARKRIESNLHKEENLLRLGS